MKEISRRTAIKALAATASAGLLSKAAAQPATAPATQAAPMTRPIPPAPEPINPPPGFGVAPGPFEPTLASLSQFKVPDWYRDAKFGIWAHWGPQCQPEQGDWYAKNMYNPTHAMYRFHVRTYGHPSVFGFKDVINEWKAAKWDPKSLIALYKKAGAKFFAAMANHHDNMDMFDSTYQPWNSVRVGPKKDIVGGWEKEVRAAGLKFAISSHGDRSWNWMQESQNADTTGPLAGVQYDGRMTRAEGKGKWWEGLDPQDLYGQYHAPGNAGDWTQSRNLPDKAYCEKFFNRIVDLINKHSPDLLYFDDTVMPIYPGTDIGPRIAAYLYNTNMAKNNGTLQCVMTGKGLNGRNADWRKALILDLERGVAGGGESIPWQTDTCIGNWHYQRSLYEQHRYKTAVQVIQMLIDIVAKNGTLMLDIPLRGDGTIDDDELKVVEGIGSWMQPNGEAIYETRPFTVYGEGPSTTATAPAGQFGGARDVRPYTPEDVRFTTKGDTLYAIVMGWPKEGKSVLKTLATDSKDFPKEIAKVELLGSGPVRFSRDAGGLTVLMPDTKPNDFAYSLKITPK